jgi:transglutaminase-like putative cysteine protease
VKRLRIRHETGFHYAGEVSTSYNEARMLPASSDRQFVVHSNLEILPISSSHTYVDYWGTRVSSFEILTPHKELSLTATSLVEVREQQHPNHALNWAELASSVERSISFVEQLESRRRTEAPDDVVAIARRLADESASPCEAAMAISTEIGRRIEYMPGATSVTSTAADAWDAGKGVCQDIAHLALGALRSVGIPARYVSGYLHPKPDAAIGETVSGESHAWVEWYCGGWRGFDPTNLIEIGDRHVTVGRGRDYDDVAPLRGVYAGPYSSNLFVRVDITREA